MRLLALGLIRAYQRWLSPYKGFSCAYRVHCGRASCSALGYRAIRRHGCWQGLGLLRERLQRCGIAHRRYGCAPAPRLAQISQRGLCDAGCDLPVDCPSCDIPSGRVFSGLCDALSWCDCCNGCSGCDWPSRRQTKAERARERWAERRRHLPPKQSERKPNQDKPAP
ncbi:MAG: membrane protein insertion efficiency factor YidD [Burkholderiaceae bacterium]|nr:membrane protein insertion efficiency factor YidD [Burkholderiaceae bacterium]